MKKSDYTVGFCCTAVIVLLLYIATSSSIFYKHYNPDELTPGSLKEGEYSADTKTVYFQDNIYLVKTQCTSYSMEEFSCKNTLLVQKVDESTNISEGDIVIFGNENFTAVHMITGIDGECYTTQGTNNITFDLMCKKKTNILYKVVGVLYTDE